MSNAERWWKVAQEESTFWAVQEQRAKRRPGLFKYTVACAGLLKSERAYVYAYDSEQAVHRARAKYPGYLNYNVLNQETP